MDHLRGQQPWHNQPEIDDKFQSKKDSVSVADLSDAHFCPRAVDGGVCYIENHPKALFLVCKPSGRLRILLSLLEGRLYNIYL